MKRMAMLLVMVVALTNISCSKRESAIDQANRDVEARVNRLKVPDNSSGYKIFMKQYLQKWGNFEISNKMVSGKIANYLQTTDYHVIWNWDTDGDGVIDYLAVVDYPGVYKGIKKGILIDNQGNVKMYIDPSIGFYAPGYTIIDFKKMGLKSDEVGCIRLLFTKNQTLFDKRQMYDMKSKYKTAKNLLVQTGGFMYQMMDKDLDMIEYSPEEKYKYNYHIIEIDYNSGEAKITYQKFTMLSPAEELKSNQDCVSNYRANKERGLVLKSFNINPDEVR